MEQLRADSSSPSAVVNRLALLIGKVEDEIAQLDAEKLLDRY